MKGPMQPGFAELFTPKLVTILREGYGLRDLRADAVAGLTVAIVALPLSMAIAIASGVGPDRGLYAAIIGGFIVSLLGGSRFQIGGPAGAFIVLVLACVMQIGVDGLVLATFMSGFMLLAVGYLRLGTFIKFIPYPVTVGFTAGIAVIIFASQIKELLGLTLAGPEPGDLLPKLAALAEALPSFNIWASLLALAAVAIMLGARRWAPAVPGMLVAVVACSLAAALGSLPVETIGSRFGGIPQSLPMPGLPEIGWDKARAALPHALAFALLGAIESLLSAVVADGMTGRRHRSNCELVAQGFANIGSSLFGGICVTGTIARTATNVRSGARGPVAGMLHSLFLLGFMLLAAPLAAHIPLAALAGVLAVVAWNMAEKHEFALLLRSGAGDALVVLAAFLLTIFRDLAEGIVVGFALGALLFIHRMSRTTAVELIPCDRADTADRYRGTDPDVIVCRITGAFFFGAASAVGAALENIGAAHRALVVDVSAVPFLDSTAANTLHGVARKAARRGVRVFVTGAAPAIRRTLLAHDVREPLVAFRRDADEALAEARASVVGQ